VVAAGRLGEAEVTKMLSDTRANEILLLYTEAMKKIPRGPTSRAIPTAQRDLIINYLRSGELELEVYVRRAASVVDKTVPTDESLFLALLYLRAARSYLLTQYLHTKKFIPLRVDSEKLKLRSEQLQKAPIAQFLSEDIDYLGRINVMMTLREIAQKHDWFPATASDADIMSDWVSFSFTRAGVLGSFVWQAAYSLVGPNSNLFLAEATLFLSYSRKDRSKIVRVTKELENHGFRTWRDEKDIVVGQPILDAVRDGISKNVEFTLIFLSPHSVRSEWCKAELRMAYQREFEMKRIFALPILIEDCEIPPELHIKKYVDLRRGVKKGVSEIANGIRLIMSRGPTA
jgi:hypothetical protein